MGLASLALGATGFISGLLDDSDDEAADASRDVAKLTARKSYPGQHSIARTLSPYLSENLDTGLTEKEQQQYRGAGRTNILQSAKGVKTNLSKNYASQGLRGGTVADALSRVDLATIPEFAKLEEGIFSMDQEKKKRSIEQILAFLSLQAGVDPDAASNNPAVPQNAVQNVINRTWGGGPGVGGADSPGTGGFGGGDFGGGFGDSSGSGGMAGMGFGGGIGGY